MNNLNSAVVVVVDDVDSTLRRAIIHALLAEGATVVGSGVGGIVHERFTPFEAASLGRDGVESLFAHAVERHGQVDVAVLTGGDLPDRSLATLSDDAWSGASRALDRVVWGLRTSLACMTPRGTGRVVVTLGAEAKVGRAGAGASAAVAHAAYGLVKVAAKEAGPQGVTVNAVLGSSLAEGSLTGRATAPTEIAAAVVLLASAGGAGMSGVAFPVDGGIAPY